MQNSRVRAAVSVKHRPLAILAADAVGYSRLMALDDVQTVASLERAREVFRRRIEAENGRVVDMAGDSVLAVFQDLLGAFHAALSVQRELSEGSEVIEDRLLRYRIGVHVGEVIEKADGTVYGDGVNIAARLQALAEPQTVAVSRSVWEIVAGSVKVEFEDLGERVLKNIPGTMRVFLARSATPYPALSFSARTKLQTPRLLEREDVLGTLHDALLSACGLRGRTCLISGEAGIGKTTVCEAFISNLSGVRLLRGGCEALLSPRPLGPVHDFILQLPEAPREAIGEIDAGPSVFPRLLACLKQEPTVLFLEDLHWADAATLDFVRYMARRVPSLPLLLLVTYRDDELAEDHPLRRVIGDLQQSVVRISLQPLSAAAVAELARQAGRSPEGVLATTGGNPFFVTELLAGEGLPRTVVDAVRGRVARQPPEVRDVLEAVSTVPGRMEHWIVDDLIDPRGDAVGSALASGLLFSDEEGVRFRHELARRAVEQSVSGSKLRRLHARIFQFLASRSDRSVPPARLVHHAKAAGLAADVLQHAPVAAREASRRGAHREAAKLYESALEAAKSAPQDVSARFLEACAWEYLVSDAATVSVERYEQALATWRAVGSAIDQGRVMTRLARAYWLRCRGDDCRRINGEAVAILQASPEAPEYLEALVEVTRAAMVSGRNGIVFDVGAKALAMAQARGNDRLVGHLLNNIGTARCQAGDLAAGVELLERSLQLGRAIHEEDLIGRYYINSAYQAVEHRRYDEAERLCAACEKEFPPGEQSDLYYWQGTGWRAHALLARGHWERAEAHARRVLGRYRGSSELPFRIHALLPLARLRILRGSGGAEDLLDEATQLAASIGEPQRVGQASAIRCEREWLLRESSSSIVDEVAGHLRWFIELGRRAYIDETAYWLWRLGHPDGAVAVDAASPRGLQITGRWSEAAAAWRALGCPLETAQALLDGDAASRDEAMAIFERLGAKAYLEKARSLSALRPTSGA
jgi:class 3 adenylate cyclase/tetratricopeptide (TPR) repeat protein